MGEARPRAHRAIVTGVAILQWLLPLLLLLHGVAPARLLHRIPALLLLLHGLLWRLLGKAQLRAHRAVTDIAIAG